jgi:hypothetical protein
MSDDKRQIGRMRPPPVPRIDASEPPIVPKRPGSSDSFPALTDSDRDLLNNVLRLSKDALEESRLNGEREARERIALEGQMKARFSDVETELAELKSAVSELRGLGGDIRGLRGDISTLNTNVMNNLAADAIRERALGELRVEMAGLSHKEGHDAGKKAGALWGALSGLAPLILALGLWVVAALLSLATGKPLPHLPGEH